MQATQASFLDILGTANTQFVIPVYQRVYSWQRKECEDLWDDIVRAGQEGKPHFVGSVLYIPETNATLTSIKKMLLIDGQQRMTTLSLIMAAFVEYLMEDESRASFLQDTKISSLRRSYLYNDDDYAGDSRYKLILSQDDKDTLFSIVGDAALPSDCAQLLIDNREFFKSKMMVRGFNAQQFWAGLRSIQVIDTQLDAGVDNAQLIFESMNSKGKALTPTDLIRNYILMSLPNAEQTKLYEGYWHPTERLFGRNGDREFNAFIWYWLWLKVPMRKPREDDAYAEFKRFKKDIFEGTTEELLAELLSYARWYACMFLDKETDRELALRFERVSDLDVKPIRPLMLTLNAAYAEGDMSHDDFLKACDAIESFLFRRAVCGKLTTGLNTFFAAMYRDLSQQADIAQYVCAMLLIHGPNMTAYFPTDEEFQQAFISRDCYYRFSKTKYYLERIENSFHPKEPIDADDYSIEHIMPQTLAVSSEWQVMLGENWEEVHETCCNSLGNLTLTGYNSELSNKSFTDKQNDPSTGYKISSLSLNRPLADLPVWNRGSIEQRSATLAKLAVNIWAYPKVPSEVVDQYRPSKATGEEPIWTIEDNHAWVADGGICHDLFEAFTARIEEEHPDWEQYVTKFYIGYRSGPRKMHLSIHPRKGDGGRLAIGLPRPVEELDDSLDIAKDKRSAGGFGPGMPTFVNLPHAGEIEHVIALVNQC